MSAGYTKLFSSIVHSTVWRESNHVRLVWVTLLALADQDGRVEASVPGLADAARVSILECEDAIEKLSAPDPYSRSKEHGGRRMTAIDGGWELLNHSKYRQRMSHEETKEKTAARVRKFREMKRTKALQALPTVTPVTNNAGNDIAEAEANTDQPPVSPPAVTLAPEPERPKRRKPKTPIRADWTPNAAHAAKAAKLGLNLDAEARKFRNNAEGKDVRWVDWDKAFHNWLENGAAFAPRGPGGKAPGATEHDRAMAERDTALLAEIHAGAWGTQAQSIAGKRPIDLRKFREAIAAGKVRRIAAPEPRSGPRASSHPPPNENAPTGSLAQLALAATRGAP